MTGQLIGYVRVSSQGQNTARQLAGIELDIEFVDKVTGSNMDREKLKECMSYARKGDTVIVESIDRLARNLRDLQEIISKLTGKGVTIKFMKENLTFTGNEDAMATLMLQMMGAFAEFERTMIKSRQREGIEAAKKLGKHLGRPEKIDDEFRNKVQKILAKPTSIRQTAMKMNVSRSTIYKVIEQLNQKGI
jgi:DNA invertase Pin-like site-specific DNA recombinase